MNITDPMRHAMTLMSALVLATASGCGGEGPAGSLPRIVESTGDLDESAGERAFVDHTDIPFTFGSLAQHTLCGREMTDAFGRKSTAMPCDEFFKLNPDWERNRDVKIPKETYFFYRVK